MTVESTTQTWRLISLPISHYCEKVRWGLDRLQLPYQEEAHLLPFHRKVTEPLGGTTVPVLVTPDQIYTDSSEILRFIDRFASEERKLYSMDDELQQHIDQLEDQFNQVLGSATRTWAYYYVLQQPELLKALWCQGIPKKELAMYPRLLPKITQMVVDALDISQDSAESALKDISQVFETVERLLSDGRSFLFGDRMTGADLTFAALAVPIILPEEHPMHHAGGLLYPRKMAREVLAFRTTLVGEFVLRMYRDYRK